MQLMPANLAINWQKAKDPSPVTYEVSILDQSCSTEVYSKEVKNALTHTVPLNSLNVASTYCLKIEARDLPGNRTKASNNSLLFKTAAPHTLPTLSGLAADGYVNASDKLTSSPLVTAATASDALAGVDSIKYLVTSRTNACNTMTNELDWSTNIPTTTSGILSSDGDYHVCVKAVDEATNTVYQAEVDFTVDTISPVFSSGFSPSAILSDGFLNSQEVAQQRHRISLRL